MSRSIQEVRTMWSGVVDRICSNAPMVDKDMVFAIIYQESKGDNFTTRYEPLWKYFLEPRIFAEKNRISVNTENVHQATSWGLMQVMGSVAREHGFEAQLPKLVTPELGVQYGVLHLKKLINKYGANETDVISAYNAGSVRLTPGKLYVNQKTYVDPVCANLLVLRQVK